MSRSPFASFQWHSDIFACDSTDIEHFYAQLQQEVERLQLGRKKLGEIGDYPLELYQSPSATAELPSVLISAGFHGEELQALGVCCISSVNCNRIFSSELI